MDNRSLVLFLGGCIPVRLNIAYITKVISPEYLEYCALFASFPMFYWLYVYFFKERTTGPDVFGGKIWWNHLRIVHAFLYLLFIILALQRKTFSYIPLLIDALLGLFSFLIYHFIYKKL